jgi:hypothetical protein
MRRFEKITFTCTITEARMIAKALMQPGAELRMFEIAVWLTSEADDLEAENEEMERFEKSR